MTDVPALKAAGIQYPETLDGWRWVFRNRHERGLAPAFLRCGRRIVVDVPRYVELMRAQTPA